LPIENWEALRKGSGREATTYEQVIFATSIFDSAENAEMHNAASHNANYTRVRRIKREFLSMEK
jgi:hypothetical protein